MPISIKDTTFNPDNFKTYKELHKDTNTFSTGDITLKPIQNYPSENNQTWVVITLLIVILALIAYIVIKRK